MFELETIDLYKGLISLAAGLVLGLERELKDKAAGIKTISVICLGATLFSIISLKYDPDRATALAAYIVSGVGFLGAGVIFKDGVNISGLTTASIIWMAAAVGTSIGFGEFYLAGAFVVISYLLLWTAPVLNKLLLPPTQTRILTVRFRQGQYDPKGDVISTIIAHAVRTEQQRLSLEEGEVELVIEVVILKKKLADLGQYLLSNPQVIRFSL